MATTTMQATRTRSSKGTPCPICHNTSGKCATGTNQILGVTEHLCMNAQPVDIAGWKFLNKVGQWNAFVCEMDWRRSTRKAAGFSGQGPTRDQIAEFEKARAEAKAKLEQAQKERLAKLLPVSTRDELWRAVTPRVGDQWRSELVSRGWSNNQIDWAMSQHWILEVSEANIKGDLKAAFFGEKVGVGLALLMPSTDGKLQGGQLSPNNRGRTWLDAHGNERTVSKYTWISRENSAKLPHTGVNPIGVYRSRYFDASKPARLIFCEGTLKPMTALMRREQYALLESTSKEEALTTFQEIWIGAAGGLFPEPALKQLLQTIGDIEAIRFAADADCFNPKKSNVFAAMKNWATDCRKLLNPKGSHPMLNPLFLNWGQYSPTAGDCDEISQTTLNNAIAMAPATFLELPKWHQRRNFTADVTVSGQYCEFQEPKNGQMLAVKAGLGSGKTHSLAKIVADTCITYAQGALIIVPTNVVGHNIINRIQDQGGKYIHHLQTDGFGNDAGSTLVLCPDSLRHVKVTSDRLVFIDEANSVMEALLVRETAIKNHRLTSLKKMEDALRESRGIVLLDANLSDRTVAFFEKLANKSATKLEHVPPSPAKTNITVIEPTSKTTIIDQIINASKRGPIIVNSDSRRDLEALAETLKNDGKTVVLVTSRTTGTPLVKQFLASPDRWISDNAPDVILMSPSAATGFDISIRNFFHAHFVWSTGVVRVDTILQMAGRVRDTSVPKVFAIGKMGKPNNLEKQLIRTSGDAASEFNNLQSVLAASYTLSYDSEMVPPAQMASAFLALAEHQQEVHGLASQSELERKALYAFAIEALRGSGKTITQVNMNTPGHHTANHKLLKNGIRIQENREIHDMQISEADLQEKPKSLEGLTRDEALKAQRISLEVRFPGITEFQEWNDAETVDLGKGIMGPKYLNFVDQLINGKMTGQALTRWAIDNIEDCRTMDRQAWQRYTEYGEFNVNRQSLLVRATTLKKAGLDQILALGEAGELHHNHPVVKKFVAACTRNQSKLGLNLGNRDKALSNILQLLGVKLSKIKQGAQGIRYYGIESSVPYAIVDATATRMMGLALAEDRRIQDKAQMQRAA
jgi:hypothetical protein